MSSEFGRGPGMGEQVLRAPYVVEAAQRAFLWRVYQWMAVGLGLTGLVAYWVAGSEAALRLVYGTPFVMLGLFLATLGLVFFIGRAAASLSPGQTGALFVLYAGLMGVLLSSVFVRYTSESIASTFFVTAGTFGVTSVFGFVTRRDLSGLGSFLFMGLVGLIIASVVNWFLMSPMITWVTTYIGVGIFVGLTAYDTQKLKTIGATVDPDAAATQSIAIQGALALYLDFVNLFLFLLRLFGNRR